MKMCFSRTKKQAQSRFTVKPIVRVFLAMGLGVSFATFAVDAPFNSEDSKTGSPDYSNQVYIQNGVPNNTTYQKSVFVDSSKFTKYKIKVADGSKKNHYLFYWSWWESGLSSNPDYSGGYVFSRVPNSKYYRIFRAKLAGDPQLNYQGGADGEMLVAAENPLKIATRQIYNGMSYEDDAGLWELVDRNGYYHIINKKTGGYLQANDYNGSRDDVNLSTASAGMGSLNTRWQLEVFDNPNGIRVDTQSKLIIFTEDSALTNPQNVKVNYVDTLQTGRTRLGNNSTGASGSFNITLNESATNSATVTTTNAVTNTSAFSHSYSETISASVKTGGLIGEVTKGFSFTATQGVTNTNSNTTTTANSATTSSTLGWSTSATVNHQAGSDLEILFMHMQSETSYPYKAVVVREYSDGYREEAEVIEGSVSDVRAGQFNYIVIDRNASVYYPEALDARDALIRNGWLANDAASMSADDYRNTLIVNLANNSSDPVSYYQSKSTDDLVYAAFVHLWANNTNIASSGSLHELGDQQKEARLLKLVILNTGAHFDELNSQLSHSLNRYNVLQKVANLSSSSASLYKFPLVEENINFKDILFYANARTRAQLASISLSSAREVMVNEVDKLTSASTSEIRSLSDNDLIAIYLLQLELVELLPNFTRSDFGTYSLGDLRNTLIYNLNITQGAGLSSGEMQARNNFNILFNLYMESGSSVLEREATNVFTGEAYKLSPKHSGLCMDVSFASVDNYVDIHQWDCYDTDSQVLYLEKNNDNTYSLRMKHSDKYIQVDTGKPNGSYGFFLTQNEDNNTDLQKWYIDNADGEFKKIRAKAYPNMCFDIDRNAADWGLKFKAYDCHTMDNQRFKFIPQT